MSLSITELTNRYPTLYHMAMHGSWPSIKKHGLLSSERLTSLFEVPEEESTALLSLQRRESIAIRHATHGQAILRDQKPLSQKSLQRCLSDCDPETWYRLLNERVFFWLSRERLKTLMSASEYVGRSHTVLYIDAASLVKRHSSSVELAHMNTGNTRPFAHPRGRSTFQKLNGYPYEARRRLKDYSAVVELTVLGGVPDIADHVIRVEHGTEKDDVYIVDELLWER